MNPDEKKLPIARSRAADLDMAFYGLLFRQKGKGTSGSIPRFVAGDLTDPLELALLDNLFELVAVAGVERLRIGCDDAQRL